MNLNRPGRRLVLLLLIISAIFALTYWSFGGIPEQWNRKASYLPSQNHLYDEDDQFNIPPGMTPEDVEEDYDGENDDGYGAEPKFPEYEDDSDEEGYKAHTPSMPSNKKLDIDNKVLTGTTIAPKLGNETAKAELGRAAWKLFHTTFARFPDKPSSDEQEALRAWVLLFARLYPCGECAGHFQKILEKFPPQVTTRSIAASWGCHVHNKVNESLDKKEFDCSKIGDFYDCGCGEDEDDKSSKKTPPRTHSAEHTNDENEEEGEVPEDEREPVELEKEELQRGG